MGGNAGHVERGIPRFTTQARYNQRMDQFAIMQSALHNVRNMMDTMTPADAALMQATAVEATINAERRNEITADQRVALLRVLNPDLRVVLVERIENDE